METNLITGTKEELIAKIMTDAWQSRITKLNELLDSSSNNDLQQEVAPGK